MRKAISLAALIALAPLAAQILGPIVNGGKKCCTFYVSQSAGSDSNPGTLAQPWKTVAKVNAATLTPGQSVGFKRGDTWHEQLAVPSSGAAGSNIAFTSYGAGANPIISGADVVGGGGWTQSNVSPLDSQTFASGGLSGGYWTNTSCTFPSSPVQGASTHSLQCVGSQQVAVAAVPGSKVIELDAYWQVSASTASSGQKTRVFVVEGSTWNAANGLDVWVTKSGSNYQLNVCLGGFTSCGTAQTVTLGTWYQLRYLVSANGGAGADFAKLYINGTLGPQKTGLTLSSAVTSNIGLGPLGAYDATVFTSNWDSLAVYNQDSTVLPNIWYTSVAWQPYSIHFNESSWGGAPQSSSTAISAPYQWFWGSNTLYVYSVGSPASTYTDPGVQAAHRAYAVTRNGKSYFTVSGLTLEGSNAATFSTPGNIFIGQDGPGDSDESSGVVLSSLDLRYTGGECGWLDSINGTWSNSTAEYCGGMGFDFDTGANMTATNLVVHDAKYGSYPGSIFSSISHFTMVNFSCTTNIAQNCLAVSLATNLTIKGDVSKAGACDISGATFNGIYFDGTTVTGASVSGCSIHGNGDGITVGAGTATNIALQFNQVYQNTTYGIYVLSGNASTTVYQNSLYANGTNLNLSGAGTGGNYRDNIAMNATTAEVNIQSTASGSITMDYNDWYHAAGGTTYMNWKGTASNFASWKTNSSLDTNSISSDPLFTNAGAGDFTLQGGSPAIAAGVYIAGVSTASPPNIGAK